MKIRIKIKQEWIDRNGHAPSTCPIALAIAERLKGCDFIPCPWVVYSCIQVRDINGFVRKEFRHSRRSKEWLRSYDDCISSLIVPATFVLEELASDNWRRT